MISVDDQHPRYDVVVVGGRPAGASLAARLGARGLTVLVVDKAELPSAPEVPSCPVIYSGSMAMLDEIGLHEDAYRAAVTRIRTFVLGFEGHFHAVFPIPMTRGRDYAYGFDRARFDHVLWDHLARFPSVTCRAGFAVSDVVRDPAGRVVGIEGAAKGGPRERIVARLAVVGADGRHSLVARKVRARVVEEQAARTSTIHFAEWEGLAPATPDGAAAIQVVATGRGKNVLFFPSRESRVAIVTQLRADRADTGGDPQGYYLSHLRSLEAVRRRIEGARQAGPLSGVRRVANRYREHGGPGWVLVGDALHHKDPLDGQGIYDALIEARHLADLLVEHHEGRTSWEALLERYRRAVLAETHGMFELTMARLGRELYSEPPVPIIRTLIRWTIQDPAYQRRFLQMLARDLPADRWTPRSFMAGVVARGLARDLGGLLRRERAG
ncbi:MAG TPA: NAD(P)/FAD-dependent oxidoreductase [Kofleriaceae bacterium]|nr:NAD(P)/FAD-dependent oxidoreductase [Kofleriaceae bacterium]